MSAILIWIASISARGRPKAWRCVGVPGRSVEARLPDANRLRSNAYASTIEGLHGYFEAFAELAEDISLWHVAILEVQFHGVRATNPQLFLFRADHEAGRAALNDEARNATVLHLLVGSGPDKRDVGHPSV